MSDALVPSAPIVLTKQYNKLWITRLMVLADSPMREASCKVSLIPYIKETGEVAPSGLGFDIVIPDVFARIEGGDTDLDALFKGILEYVSKEAKNTGKFS